MGTAPRQATAADYELAEGPIWDPVEKVLHWVDIVAGTVQTGRLADDGTVVETSRRHVDRTVGAVTLTDREGTILVAGAERILLVDDSGITEAARVLSEGDRCRLNDGTADPSGRYLVGSCARDGDFRDAALYRWQAGGSVEVVRAEAKLSNGIGFSPDGRVIFFADSTRRRVQRADYDPVRGAVGGWRTIIETAEPEVPDGLTVDAEGCLWLAIWGGYRVCRYSAEGDLLETVALPVPEVTCPGFAGADLRTLVITTGREAADRRRYPASGALFTVRTQVPGLEPLRVRLERAQPHQKDAAITP